MKLSIFKKAKTLPTKSEKSFEAKYTSKPYSPETVDVYTDDDVINVITSYCWSPFVFKEFRREDNFISTDFLVYDIDEGQTIEEVEKVIHQLDIVCIVLPTTSHTNEFHRFRVVLPLSKTITNVDIYKATFAKIAKFFSIDPACSDVARFFFGSTMTDGFLYSEGKLLDPEIPPEKVVNSPKIDYNTKESVVVGESLEELVIVLYGEIRAKIPESIAYFLENAPDNLANEWYVRGNSFLYTAALSGCDDNRIRDVFYKLYQFDITPKIEYSVDRIILDGKNAREERVNE